MTFSTFFIGFICGVVTVALWRCFWCHVPMGHEDETGFHQDPPEHK